MPVLAASSSRRIPSASRLSRNRLMVSTNILTACPHVKHYVNDFVSRLEASAGQQSAAVPTLEGSLVRAWRESEDLTQEALGALVRPRQLNRQRVHNIERGGSSLSVSSLLNIIRALGVAGGNDAARLVRFFQ